MNKFAGFLISLTVLIAACSTAKAPSPTSIPTTLPPATLALRYEWTISPSEEKALTLDLEEGDILEGQLWASGDTSWIWLVGEFDIDKLSFKSFNWNDIQDKNIRHINWFVSPSGEPLKFSFLAQITGKHGIRVFSSNKTVERVTFLYTVNKSKRAN